MHAVDQDGLDQQLGRAGYGGHIIRHGHAGIHRPGAVQGGALAVDAALRLGKPCVDCRSRIFHAQSVRAKGVELGGDQRPAVGQVEGTRHQFGLGAPEHAAELRRIKHVDQRGVAAVHRGEVLAGTPGTVANDDVVIPHHQGTLGPAGAEIGVQILRILTTKAVPIAGRMVGGEHPHPVLHVNQALHVGNVVGIIERQVGVRRVNHGKHVGVVVGRVGGASNFVIIAVPRELLGPAGGGVGVEIRPAVIVEIDRTARRRRTKFKPWLHFVQITGGVVGEILFDQIGVRTLGVLHQGPPAVAVHIDRHIAPVQPGNPQSPHEKMGGLLALNTPVIPRPIAGLVDLVERSRAQKLVIIVEHPFIMAQTPIGSVKALVVRAARKPGGHVVDDAVAIHHGAVD